MTQSSETIIDTNNTRIISLGDDCRARTFIDQMRLFDYKASRKTRMPFDGCYTPYNAMYDYIFSDFHIDREKLLVSGRDIIYRNCVYNHEKNTDLDRFVDNMNTRAAQFKQELQGESPVIFYLQHNKPPVEVVNLLNKKYPKLKYKIFCHNRFNTGECKSTDFYHFINIKPPAPVPYSGNYLGTMRDLDKIPNHPVHEYTLKILKEFLHTLSKLSNKDYDVDSIFSNRKMYPSETY